MAERYITRCNIPDENGHTCDKEIAITAGIVAPKIGEAPEGKAKKYVQAIVAHLMKDHPGHCQLAMNSMEHFLAFNVSGFCRTDDPGVVEFMQHFAEHLRTMAVLPVTDKMILELVTRMGYTMEDPRRKQVLTALMYVRNFQLGKVSADATAEDLQLTAGPQKA